MAEVVLAITAIASAATAGFGAVAAAIGTTALGLGVTLVSAAASVGMAAQQQQVAKKKARQAAIRGAGAGGAAAESRGAAKPQSVQQTARGSTLARLTPYGTARVGGQVVFLSAKDGSLVQTVAIAHGYVDAILATYLDGKEVSVRWDGYVTSYPYAIAGYFRVALHFQNGSNDKTAAPVALAAFFPSVWTTDHRMQGIANVTMVLNGASLTAESYNTVFRSGIPEIAVLVRGRRVWDPRDAAQVQTNSTTWTWSDNAALCIADFLTRRDGFNLPPWMIDVDALTEAANVCDETVALKAGGTEKRYRLSGVYDLTTDPVDALEGMLEAMAGRLVIHPSTGKFILLPGKWRAPTVHFGPDDIVSCDLAKRVDATTSFNTAKFTYVSPAHGYTEQEGQAWIDAASVARLGVNVSAALPLPWVISHAQGRRLAKAHAARGNPEWSGSVTLNVRGLLALGETMCSITIPPLGIASEPFEINRIQISGDMSTVRLEISHHPQAMWTWSAASEEGDAPPVPASTDPAESIVPPPDELAAEVSADNYGRFRWRVLRATMDAATADYDAEVRYRVVGAPTWTTGVAVTAFSGTSAGGLAGGSTYEWQVRTLSASRGVYSEWASGTNFVATVATAAPASASISAVNGTNAITYTVTLPAATNVGGATVEIYADGGALAYTATFDHIAGSTLTVQVGLAPLLYSLQAKARTIGLVSSASWSAPAFATSFAATNASAPGNPTVATGGAGSGASDVGSGPTGIDAPGNTEPPGGSTSAEPPGDAPGGPTGGGLY
jgi:hypothetical protein